MAKFNYWGKTKCYKLVHSFRVTFLFTGQYNTKTYGSITVLYSEWLDQDLAVRIQMKSPPTILARHLWFWREP